MIVATQLSVNYLPRQLGRREDIKNVRKELIATIPINEVGSCLGHVNKNRFRLRMQGEYLTDSRLYRFKNFKAEKMQIGIITNLGCSIYLDINRMEWGEKDGFCDFVIQSRNRSEIDYLFSSFEEVLNKRHNRPRNSIIFERIK